MHHRDVDNSVSFVSVHRPSDMGNGFPYLSGVCTVPCLCVLCYNIYPNIYTALRRNSTRAKGDHRGIGAVRAQTRSKDQTAAKTAHILKHAMDFDIER